MAVGMVPSSFASFFGFVDPLYIVEGHWCPGILGERFSKGGDSEKCAGFFGVRAHRSRPGAPTGVSGPQRERGAGLPGSVTGIGKHPHYM